RNLHMATRPLLVLTILCFTRPPAPAAEPFALRPGDRVVLVGDTLVERERHSGWLELALTARWPDRDVTFRNLGWSADTPAGASRAGLSLLQAGLEPPDEGWKQLREQLRQARPTAAVVGYGTASSFAGEAGLPQFTDELNRLLDTIQEVAGAEPVRFLLLGPVRGPDHPRPTLAPYARAVRDVAAARGAASRS